MRPGPVRGPPSHVRPLSPAQIGSRINYLPQALSPLADRAENNRIREDSARPSYMRSEQLRSALLLSPLSCPPFVAAWPLSRSPFSAAFCSARPFVPKNLHASETRQKPILKNSEKFFMKKLASLKNIRTFAPES